MEWGLARTAVNKLVAGLFLALLLSPPRLLSAQTGLDEGLSRAHQSLERGDLNGAEKQLRELARLYPKSFVVHNDLGALYLQQQRYQQACRELAIAVGLNPGVADVQRNLGTCHFLRGDFANALGPLERAKALDADDLRTRYQLGYSLLMLGRPDEAQIELELVSSRMPGEERTLFALVKVYQAKRDQDKAAGAFQKLQQAHPDSVFVHILMGESYDIQEKLDEAVGEYQKALAMAPEMARLHFDLGFLYWEKQRFQDAAAEFQQELKINPDFTPAYYYLGDIALEQNDPAGAASFFLKAISRNSSCLDAYVGLGKSYFRLHDMLKAVGAFEKANQLDTSQPDVHYWLAKSYRATGQSDKGEQELKRFQSLKDKVAAAPPASQPAHDRWTSASCMASTPPRSTKR